MYKILIVEDDRVIADKMKEHLEKWDYEVACVQDFKRVQEEYTAFDPQLVIMDIILPFYNGFHWCTQIRQISSVPILFLSSASDNMNIVMAMNMGGDDFVEKPFDLNVLTAKIQALLRRAYSFTGQLNVLEYRDVILNLNDAAVTFHGERMELTKNDFKILQILMENAGKIVKRDRIMERLWESDEFIDDNTLTGLTHMNKYYMVHSFTKYAGLSPIQYLNQTRLKRAQHLLKNTNYSISDIASSTGFSSQSYFTQIFRKNFNMTPVKYRQEHAKN